MPVIFITARHMDGGSEHQHIARVRWVGATDNTKTGESSRQEIVDWMASGSGVEAFVLDGARKVRVVVVNGNPPYLRTRADGQWTDSLLALPAF